MRPAPERGGGAPSWPWMAVSGTGGASESDGKGEVLVVGTVIIAADVPSFEGATLRLRLEEVGRADAPAALIAEAAVEEVAHAGPRSGETRVAFVLRAPRAPIHPRGDYAVRACLRLRGDADQWGHTILSTTERRPVLTRGFGRDVTLRLGPG